MAPKRTGEQLNLKSIEAVERALQVLRFLQHCPGGATPTALAAGTGVNRTTVMRIVVTLSESSYVTYNPVSGTYSLGPGALELSAAYLSNNDLPSASLPELLRLRDETQETVSVYLRDGLDRICIQRVESLQGLRRSVQLGQRLPMYQGAAGKVLLALLPDEKRETLFRQMPIDTVALESLRCDVRQARDEDFALSIAEREPGVAAAAVPIRYRSGTEAAALGVSGPQYRLDPDKLRELKPLLQETARRIAGRLFA